MKTLTRFLTALLFAGLLFAPAVCVRAQAASGSAQPAAQPANGTIGTAAPDEPENDPELEQYRHSSTVQAIARITHLETETVAQIFEDLNSAIVIVAIGVFLWKMLPKMFRSRSEMLQKELVQARLATEEANRRLAEVEARLLRLDSVIDGIRQQVEQESVQDEKRIHAALEAERERIIASAEQEIGATQAAAQRELKNFAANLAIDNAMRRIQLSNDTDRALVREFGKSLNKNSGGEA
ncbi:MAG: ATP synthase F0 subunit B [Acidobacteriaceae bacterium]